MERERERERARKKSEEWTSSRENDKTERTTGGTRQKNKRGDSKEKPKDSPEIPDSGVDIRHPRPLFRGSREKVVSRQGLRQQKENILTQNRIIGTQMHHITVLQFDKAIQNLSVVITTPAFAVCSIANWFKKKKKKKKKNIYIYIYIYIYIKRNKLYHLNTRIITLIAESPLYPSLPPSSSPFSTPLPPCFWTERRGTGMLCRTVVSVR